MSHYWNQLLIRLPSLFPNLQVDIYSNRISIRWNIFWINPFFIIMVLTAYAYSGYEHFSIYGTTHGLSFSAILL